MYQDAKAQKMTRNFEAPLFNPRIKQGVSTGATSNRSRRRAGVCFDFNNANERADFEMFMKEHADTILNQLKDKDRIKQQKDEKLAQKLGYIADP